jgi:heme-degrading monooxygenase HmoA
MIIRIVKMAFDPDKVNDFLEIFNSSKQYIRNFKGCSHLELLNDINSPNIFFTYSYWQNENDLNNYRHSELFEHVWCKTKVLFAAKAQAWSVEQKVVVV